MIKRSLIFKNVLLNNVCSCDN